MRIKKCPLLFFGYVCGYQICLQIRNKIGSLHKSKKKKKHKTKTQLNKKADIVSICKMSRVGFHATKMSGILYHLHAPTSFKHIGSKNEICGNKVVSISGFTACICFNYCYSERWKPQSVSVNLLSLSPHLSQKHSQKTVVKQFLQFVVFAYLPSSLIQSCCFWSSKWIVSSSWKWRHSRVSASSCIFCL